MFTFRYAGFSAFYMLITFCPTCWGEMPQEIDCQKNELAAVKSGWDQEKIRTELTKRFSGLFENRRVKITELNEKFDLARNAYLESEYIVHDFSHTEKNACSIQWYYSVETKQANCNAYHSIDKIVFPAMKNANGLLMAQADLGQLEFPDVHLPNRKFEAITTAPSVLTEFTFLETSEYPIRDLPFFGGSLQGTETVLDLLKNTTPNGFSASTLENGDMQLVCLDGEKRLEYQYKILKNEIFPVFLKYQSPSMEFEGNCEWSSDCAAKITAVNRSGDQLQRKLRYHFSIEFQPVDNTQMSALKAKFLSSIPNGTKINLGGRPQIGAFYENGVIKIGFSEDKTNNIESAMAAIRENVTTEISHEHRSDDLWTTRNEFPYCGVYAAYAIITYHQLPVDFEKLVNEHYISSVNGSTAADIGLALSENGLLPEFYKSLSRYSLVNSDSPLILHVASAGQLDAYNHWLVFAGVSGNNARVMGDDGQMNEIPFGELLARWDGVAVFSSPSTSFRVNLPKAESHYFLVSSSLVFALFILTDSLFPAGRKIIRDGIVFSATFSVVLLSTLFFCVGLSAYGSINKYVMNTLVEHKFETIQTEEVKEVIAKNACTLVDARDRLSFSFGSIPTAVNIPIDCLDSNYCELLPEDLDGTIVVFCQSPGCRYAHRVASYLKLHGYRNICIYGDGYVGWQQESQTTIGAK